MTTFLFLRDFCTHTPPAMCAYMYVCMSACRERERKRVCVCVCVRAHAFVHMLLCVPKHTSDVSCTIHCDVMSCDTM